MIRSRAPTFAALTVVATLAARPALAGPPLVCFPFDIGGAATLPMGTNGLHDIDPPYDVSHLLARTPRLLEAKPPVIVRRVTTAAATSFATANTTAATTRQG